jgi:hypothetical protein
MPETGYKVEISAEMVGKILDRYERVVGIMPRQDDPAGTPCTQVSHLCVTGHTPGACFAVHPVSFCDEDRRKRSNDQ